MKSKLALCALAICLISSIATAQQISVNYNHNQSFANYHTYAWGSNNANQIQNSTGPGSATGYQLGNAGQGVADGAGEPESRGIGGGVGALPQSKILRQP
jgi:opacity protein-like surface antigen